MKKKKEEKTENGENIKFDFSIIDQALLGLTKELGKDVLVDTVEHHTWERIKSRSPTLGWICGKGGIPKGGIIELFGPESGGKSLVAQNIIADFQQANEFAVYIDTEYSFNPEYAEVQGMKTDKQHLAVIHPDTGEDAFEAAVQLVRTKQVGIVVVDSLATCLPSSEDKGSMNDQQMGAQARMIGKGLRKLLPIASKAGTTIILINQIRMKIGISWGNPETTPGGNAPKFYSCIRLDIRKGDKEEGDKDTDDMLGQYIKVKNVKNKTSVPYRKGQVFCSFTEGLDVCSEYCDFAVSFNIIEKKGAWFSYGGSNIGQGKNNTVKFLKENPDIYEEIKKAVDSKLNTDTTLNDPAEDIEKESIADLAEQALNF